MLLFQLSGERKRSSDVESSAASLLARAGTLRAEVAKLKKEKEELLNDAKAAISATEETMKAHVCVLALEVNVSVMQAFRTAKDREIMDVEWIFYIFMWTFP